MATLAFEAFFVKTCRDHGGAFEPLATCRVGPNANMDFYFVLRPAAMAGATPHLQRPAGCMIDLQPLETGNASVAQEVQEIFALAYWQEAAAIGISDADASTIRGVEDIMNSAEFHLGARIRGELVGVLTIGPDAEGNQVALTALVVHPAHQRLGVARSLVQEALARGRGFVFSVIASADNLPALSLYKSFGFEPYREGLMGQAQLPMVKLRTHVS